MEVTQQFLNRLRHELNTELVDEWGESSESTAQRADVLAALDRACLATVLNGGEPTPVLRPNKRLKAGSQAARDRAKKAAETRKKNREKADEGGGQ